MSSNPGRLALVSRAATELPIIVVGVLIALTADAWFAGRKDREAEARHLIALHEDLVESTRLLEESNDVRTRLFASLVQLSEVDLAATPGDSVSRWVYDGLFLMGSFEPRLTALRELESTDQLQLLTPEVRRAIAELNRRLSDWDRVENDFLRSQQSLVDPYLVRVTPLAPILALADSLPLSARLPTTPDWSGLETVEAQNAIAFKLSLGKLAMRYRTAVSAQFDTLRVLVDARLADLGLAPGAG